MTHPLPNFNGSTVKVSKWIINFIPHFTGHVITYPCWDWSETMLVKGLQIEKIDVTQVWCFVHRRH